MGVGGIFDVLAGDKQRAPEWVQTLNIEWLYRLVREPARLGRQASTLPAFVLRILAARLAASGAREGDAR
jgi:N-acetylglucosaminyldiphosphoundecaprenol N-acetyl-beta-D-mannosaminyltransferase